MFLSYPTGTRCLTRLASWRKTGRRAKAVCVVRSAREPRSDITVCSSAKEISHPCFMAPSCPGGVRVRFPSKALRHRVQPQTVLPASLLKAPLKGASCLPSNWPAFPLNTAYTTQSLSPTLNYAFSLIPELSFSGLGDGDGGGGCREKLGSTLNH